MRGREKRRESGDFRDTTLSASNLEKPGLRPKTPLFAKLKRKSFRHDSPFFAGFLQIAPGLAFFTRTRMAPRVSLTGIQSGDRTLISSCISLFLIQHPVLPVDPSSPCFFLSSSLFAPLSGSSRTRPLTGVSFSSPILHLESCILHPASLLP